MPFFDRFKKTSEISPEKRQELFDKIVVILAKTLKIDKEITPESRITEDLGADSLETVELVMALEEELNIEIPDEDAEKMKTIDDVIIYLSNRLKEQKG